MKVVFLEISSFTYCGSFGAEHFYGKLVWSDKKEEYGTKKIDILKPLSQKEAIYLNKKCNPNGFALYKKGELSEKFETKEELVRYAIREFNKIKQKESILLEGSHCVRSPMKILVYPKSLNDKIKRLKELYSLWDSKEYEYNDKLSEKLDDEWWGLTKEWFME